MPHHADEQFDHALLDLIEHSSTGAVPQTPTHQDALRRLIASHTVYSSAEHAGNYVTARSLSGLPSFSPNNLHALFTGEIEAVESNASVFERYVHSLPAALQSHARSLLATVAGRPAKNRAKHGMPAAHDPVHALFLVPGAGSHPGLPGNYLYGFLAEGHAGATGTDWSLHLHDREDGEAVWHTADVKDAVAKLEELLESAPFHLRELEAFGFAVS